MMWSRYLGGLSGAGREWRLLPGNISTSHGTRQGCKDVRATHIWEASG